MKFKVLPGCELFDKLTALHEKIEKTKKEIKAFLQSKGFTGEYGHSSDQYITACHAIEIEGAKPEGWKQVGEKYQGLYYPLAKNKTALKELRDLPSVKSKELNDLVNFHFQVGPNLEIYRRPGVAFSEEYILLHMPPDSEPVAGMIEILESEYNTLEKKIEEKLKEATER